MHTLFLTNFHVDATNCKQFMDKLFTILYFTCVWALCHCFDWSRLKHVGSMCQIRIFVIAYENGVHAHQICWQMGVYSKIQHRDF